MQYKRTTLPNGLRIITVPAKGNPAVTVLVTVEAGSNYETKGQNGLSHFLEHMCFKGTKKRPTVLDIALELDGLGAENNAFTSNECTGYYAKAEKRYFKKILDVISDMHLNPKFARPDIEKERGVILQEISMYEDKPERQVWYELIKLLYGDTPAGRPVIGSTKTVKSFSRQDFIAYREKHYVANATIIVVAGDLEHKIVVDEVKKSFSTISTAKKHSKVRVIDKQNSPALKLKKKKTDQTHMLVAFRTYDITNKRDSVVEVIAGVLGSGMSSRLFQKVRTQMGACYSVHSFNAAYSDHGSLVISTGIEKARAEEVVTAILEECKRLTNELVPPEELQKTKDYLIGHLYMRLETTDSLAHFYGEDEIARGKAKQVSDIEKEIRAVSPKDIMKIAKEIFQNKNLNLAVVGDIRDEKSLKKVLLLDK